MIMQWQEPSIIKVGFKPLFCFHWFWLRGSSCGEVNLKSPALAKKHLPYKTSLHTALQSADTGHGNSYSTSFVIQEEKRSNPPINSGRVNFFCSFGSNRTQWKTWVWCSASHQCHNDSISNMSDPRHPTTQHCLYLAHLKSKVFFIVWRRLLLISLILSFILRNTKQTYLLIYYFQPH